MKTEDKIFNKVAKKLNLKHGDLFFEDGTMKPFALIIYETIFTTMKEK